MATGFIRVNRGFLQDGQTLLIVGIQDDAGNVRRRMRVLPGTASPHDILRAYETFFGFVDVTALEVPPELMPLQSDVKTPLVVNIRRSIPRGTRDDNDARGLTAPARG